jgi:hypothetical protein
LAKTSKFSFHKPVAPRSRIHRAGDIAIHSLSPAEAEVDTVFIRRREAPASTALTAFLATVRVAEARMAAE